MCWTAVVNPPCASERGIDRIDLTVTDEEPPEELPLECVHTRLCVVYLVDPASSHMLVSKIKPCMSKYVPPYTAKLRMAH